MLLTGSTGKEIHLVIPTWGGGLERDIFERQTRSILSSFIKNHGHDLDGELFHILITEVEAIFNS